MQQRCPRCKSDRIRHGYRHTPLLLKLVFRYSLLCDSCNWEFNGFAVPGTVPSRTRRKKDKLATSQTYDSQAEERFEETSAVLSENDHDEEPEIALSNEESHVSQELDTNTPKNLQKIEIEANETAKKKKTKKRVKLRLN